MGVGFNFYQKHDLIIQNLHFSGFAFAAIESNQTNNITVRNNEFMNSARSIRNWEDTGTKFLYNKVTDMYVEGLLTLGSKSLEIGYNLFKDICTRTGTSYSNWTYFGVNFSSDSNVPSAPYNVHDNVLINIGYIGINAYGPGTIKNNYIQRPMTMLNDGGGIAFDQNYLNAGNMIIENNIINDCVGNVSGSAPVDYYNYVPLCFGIYYGNRQLNNVITRNNTVIKTTIGFTIDHSLTSLDSSGSGPSGPVRGHQVYGNTFFGFTETGGYHGDYSTYTYPGLPSMTDRANAPAYFMSQYNDVVHDNIFYAGSSSATMQNTLHVYSNGQVDPVTGILKKTNFFGTVSGVTGYSNNNYYYNPYGLGSMAKIRCEYGSYGAINSCGGSNFISFEQWRSAPSSTNKLGTSQDQSSVFSTGSGVSGLQAASTRGVIYFNNSNVAKTFTLESCLVNLNGTSAGSIITLQPFESRVFERKTVIPGY